MISGPVGRAGYGASLEGLVRRHLVTRFIFILIGILYSGLTRMINVMLAPRPIRLFKDNPRPH